jgi:tol-pal system protein YbgF
MKRLFFARLAGWPARFAMVAAALVLSAPAGAQDTTRRQELRPGPSASGGGQYRGSSGQTQSSGDGGHLEKRVERVEEQVVDMQSQIGAIESLARSGGASGGGADSGGGYSGDGGGDLATRVQGLETQLRTLSGQMSEIIDRLSRLDGQAGGPRGGRQGALAPPSGGDAAGSGRQSTWRPAGTGGSGFGAATVEPADQGAADGGVPVSPAADRRGAGSPPRAGGYDSRTGGYDSGRQDGMAGGSGESMKQRLAATPPSGGVETSGYSSPDGRRLYDQAYGMLIARDFQGATDGFSQFLQRYGSDPLAGSAQYWLGQASFELGDYRKAADMFLKGFKNYPRSEKAPESLLKLGIALKRLNENDAACESFAEFGRRFPQAPQALQQRAEQERRRAGCQS